MIPLGEVLIWKLLVILTLNMQEVSTSPKTKGDAKTLMKEKLRI